MLTKQALNFWQVQTNYILLGTWGFPNNYLCFSINSSSDLHNFYCPLLITTSAWFLSKSYFGFKTCLSWIIFWVYFESIVILTEQVYIIAKSKPMDFIIFTMNSVGYFSLFKSFYFVCKNDRGRAIHRLLFFKQHEQFLRPLLLFYFLPIQRTTNFVTHILFFFFLVTKTSHRRTNCWSQSRFAG